MKELTLQATREALVDVQAFVEEVLAQAELSMRACMQISLCVEELYINIASYAYYPDVGNVTIRCGVEGDPKKAIVQFEDEGKPFDPLAKKDADITLSADEREIGGLGILMVKKTMSAVRYQREDGKNILTIEKVQE